MVNSQGEKSNLQGENVLEMERWTSVGKRMEQEKMAASVEQGEGKAKRNI